MFLNDYPTRITRWRCPITGEYGWRCPFTGYYASYSYVGGRINDELHRRQAAAEGRKAFMGGGQRERELHEAADIAFNGPKQGGLCLDI